MTNLFDYLHWRGDLSLAMSPFNEVDAMILARLAYEPFEHALSDAAAQTLPDSYASAGAASPTPSESRAFAGAAPQPLPDSLTIAEAAPPILAAPDLAREVILPEDPHLLEAVADTDRFRSMRLSAYENRIDLERQAQFSAITIELEPEIYYVAFRGTDDTLVGWKEDFNMCFISPVPAQEMAVSYLERLAGTLKGRLLLGGHSKGGNLAVYAAAFCSPAVQERIDAVYNFDGPGFDRKILDMPGYQRICARTHTFVPQSSIVGMLLCHEEKYTIVHSTRPIGLLQHDVYTWEIDRKHLLYLETVTNSSRIIDSTLKDWLADTDYETREEFVDAIFRILEDTNALTLKELEENWFRNARTILHSIKNMDEPTREAVIHTLRALTRYARAEIRHSRHMRPSAAQPAEHAGRLT